MTPGFVGSVILLSFPFLLFQQVPTASVTIEGASALNRVRWAQAGKEVAVGDSEGRIWVYDVGEVSSFGTLLWGFWFCWGFSFRFVLFLNSTAWDCHIQV